MQDELKIIWTLAIGLSLACLFGYFTGRLKLSPILGYLLAGYAIGPHFPGFTADPKLAHQLANIGITLLLFAVGLHFSWKDLAQVKKISLPGALLLALISIALGYALSTYLGLSWRSGVIIGAAICVSSTVVIVRVLTDQNLLHTLQGHIVVGWTLVEDIVALFILILLPVISLPIFQDHAPVRILMSFGFLFLKIIALFVIVYFLGEKVIKFILNHIARTRSHELFTLAILSIVFLIAVGSASLFGISLALGAFIAGTVVGKTDLSHQAAANALPMRDAFAVIFFLSVGMLFNPIALKENLPLFFGLLLIILVIKTVLAFSFIRLFKYPLAIAATVALAISQIGEYSYILVEEGSRLNLLPKNAYDIIVACSLVSIAINPLLFNIFKPFTSKHVSKIEPKRMVEDGLIEMTRFKEPLKPRAIVVGYGQIGKTAAHLLRERGYSVLIIERDVDTVARLKQTPFDAVFGDASQPQLLERADLDNAELIIVTIPEYSVMLKVIQTIYHINPEIKIITRIRLKVDLNRFSYVDIPTVCDEVSASKGIADLIENYIQEVK